MSTSRSFSPLLAGFTSRAIFPQQQLRILYPILIYIQQLYMSCSYSLHIQRDNLWLQCVTTLIQQTNLAFQVNYSPGVCIYCINISVSIPSQKNPPPRLLHNPPLSPLSLQILKRRHFSATVFFFAVLTVVDQLTLMFSVPVMIGTLLSNRQWTPHLNFLGELNDKMICCRS